jgi:hypothetical protein
LVSFQKISLHKLILIIIGIAAIAMGVMVFIYPPSIYPDSSNGFQVMRSMQMGGGFNLLIGPDQDDISKNVPAFISWWSPGQYLVPYFFKSIFSINTGQASALTITIFELLGLVGFYSFFKKIGFAPIIAAISLLFIACQQAFVIPYVFYNGGEILLFGFEGWFLYGCLSIEKPGIKLVAFTLLSGWLGFLCKSSFMWIYASGLLCLWIRLSAKTSTIRSYVKNGIWLAVPAVASLVAIYIFYLSKGTNPASASSGLNITWQTFSFPLGSPFISGFSVDDIVHGLVYHPMGSLVSPGHALIILLCSAVISLILIAVIILYIPNDNYRLFILVFYTMSVLFFSWAFLRQLNISYEGRHFRIIGLLIVPGVIYLISWFKPAFQLLFVLLCAGIAINNYSFLATRYLINKNNSARGNSGIAQEYIDQPSLNYIMNLDRQNNDAIFAFANPDLGLEIEHNRIITINAPQVGDTIDYGDYVYDGHAGPLYMLLPTSYTGARAAMLMKFFPGYSNFLIKKLSPAYVLYAAK